MTRPADMVRSLYAALDERDAETARRKANIAQLKGTAA
jgi:hypothetical protein